MTLLRSLFHPGSVAVIGASSDKNKLGGRLLHFMLKHGYGGAIYPVHPTQSEVQGLQAWPSVTDIPHEVEQAIVLVGPSQAEAVLQACAKKGVRVVQVLSSGFAEAGPEGAVLQDRLTQIASAAGMRLNGPNALGTLDPSHAFYATFSTALNGICPEPGKVAFATQSGAFGSCAYVMAARRGIGIGKVIATGNEADIDVAEAIALLAEDDDTHVICAAIESCRSGSRLRAALQTAARNGKPVVIMKVGSSEVGAAAAATHTGSLSGDDRIYDTVVRECAAHRAHSIEEMIDTAYLCALGRMPQNNRLAVVTVSGGIGILAADAAAQNGMELAAFPPELAADLNKILPFGAGRNPLDTTAQVAVKREAIGAITARIADSGMYGSVILYLANNALAADIFAPVEESLARIAKLYPQLSLVTVMPAADSVRRNLEAAGIAVFEDPSRAVKALASAVGITRMRRGLQRSGQRSIPHLMPAIDGARNEREAKIVLAEMGVASPPETLCISEQEAVNAARAIGYPVVAKIVSEDIIHKSDIGGVILSLDTDEAVRAAYAAILSRGAAVPEARIDGVLIAPMLTGGVETIIGAQVDPVFGPMVMFGLGGVHVEIFKDVAFASAPVTRERAHEMLEEVRARQMLSGFRGAPHVDRSALVDAICLVSELSAANWERLNGLEINPFLALPSGGYALDAVIHLQSSN